MLADQLDVGRIVLQARGGSRVRGMRDPGQIQGGRKGPVTATADGRAPPARTVCPANTNSNINDGRGADTRSLDVGVPLDRLGVAVVARPGPRQTHQAE